MVGINICEKKDLKKNKIAACLPSFGQEEVISKKDDYQRESEILWNENLGINHQLSLLKK